MKIFVTSLGDVIYREQKAIVIRFKGKRNVLSTSPLNGAYSEKLNYVYNYDGTQGPERIYVFKEPTYKEHLKKIAEKLGLKPEFTSGISTAASMDNVSIKEESYKGITTTAIVTAGVDINGCRAGDPASYDERDLLNGKKKFGTINIILEIDARLTDGNIIIGNLDSSIYLTDTGKNSKLGELIGLSVKKAVKEALFKQENCDPESQHSILKRFKRFGITEKSLWTKYNNIFEKDSMKKFDFIHHFQSLDKENKLVTISSLIIHLLDEYQWGLLGKTEVNEEIETLYYNLAEYYKINEELLTNNLNKKNFVEEVVSNYEKIIVTIIRRKVFN